MDLFSQTTASDGPTPEKPLAERVRPVSLEQYVGQEHIIGPDSALRTGVAQGHLSSLILWGPPGVGKTTLAKLLARTIKADFVEISAVTSGVADVRKTIERAGQTRKYYQKTTLLFIDEIHRFNKSQQDALLHAVEDGTLILIGATTENPSFEVIAPLLSRCQVFMLKPLTNAQIRTIIEQALKNDDLLREKQVNIESWESLYVLADGDARRALNAVENAVHLLNTENPPLRLSKAVFEKAAQKKVLYYDKSGDYHYDLISAFIKSLRGSDPDAALYWMARMLAAGEDPRFIARRMLILASEDIGNADPQALVLATSCFTAVTYLGMPECRITLSQTAVYLAAAPKSNASYVAIEEALRDVKQHEDVQVPLHLRNAPTGLMKSLDYGKGYRYAHDFEDHFVGEHYLPPPLEKRVYYRPADSGRERELGKWLQQLWKGLKSYTGENSEDNQDSP